MVSARFDSLTDLQSSQTVKRTRGRHQRFDSLTDLQSSQTGLRGLGLLLSLIPLLIYKALKHEIEILFS